MFKKNKVRVVPVEEYTDFSERETKYATRKDVAIMSAIPTIGAVGLFGYNKLNTTNVVTNHAAEQLTTVSYQVVKPVPDVPPTTLPQPQPDAMLEGAVQTGYIADKSLEMLANILDPLIDIMVAISFPIASVIMVGGCFFFMLGNSEKAWSMIMNASLGYVLISLSPLFLDILRTLGNTV